MATRARTFSWANRLLPRRHRDDMATLYAFCRLIDDLADDRKSDVAALRVLDEVQLDLGRRTSKHPIVASFLRLARRRAIPLACASELVEGVRSDVGRVRIETHDDLLRYCYRVASTVGVMICNVLEIDEPAARPFAVDLGIGMQLTNIARDVLEDFGADRIYLPAELIDHSRVAAALGGDGAAETELFLAVRSLLAMASRYYRSADLGMHFLPARARWGILTASRSYEAIGARIEAMGIGYWRGRAATSGLQKVGATLEAGLSVMLASSLSRGPYPARHERSLHRALAPLESAQELGLGP
ncbi:MAG: phytoene/squalene synthase family protein [Acidobacteria bacterium]|nr:phytoene/squalene synthase family protein [Acidobacteriota bacterium]